MIVSIEGCIGSGKSTTARMVAKSLSYSVLLEETASHPFLAAFYTKPEVHALETELGFVLLHYHQFKAVGQEAGLVADFSPGKDIAFARMNLAGRDLKLFEHVYSELSSRIARPNLAVFLDLPIPALMDRIQRRGRPYEQGVPVSYIQRLRESYLEHRAQLADTIAVVEVSSSDNPEAVAEKALRTIRRAL